jgi:hypothetical protein
VSYEGDRYISQGKQNLIQAVMTLAGGLTEQARQAKELRTTLSTIDPEGDYSSMGLSELKGTYAAMEQQEKQRAAELLRDETISRIAASNATVDAAKGRATAEGAMSDAMRAALPPVQNRSMTLQGLPMTPNALGAMPSVFPVNVPTQGQPTSSSLIAAMMQNPQSVNSEAGRSVMADFMRNNMMQRGAPQSAMVGGLPVIFQPYSGQFEIDPRVKIESEAKARAATRPESGERPIEYGDYYWNEKDGWRYKGNRKGSLFAPGDITSADSGGSVEYVWKNGKLEQVQR